MVFILFVLCVILAGAFLYMESRDKYVSAVILKGAASLCFVVIGMICGPGTGMAAKIICGLALGCVADVLLNLRLVFRKKGDIVFLAGIVVFLAGHILYLAAVYPLLTDRMICVISCLILTTALLAWIFRRITVKPAFKIIGSVYVGIIVFLNCIALDNMIRTPSSFSLVFAVGAALFLASDIGLILNTFTDHPRQGMKIINICLYYAGQLFIAASLFFLQAG